MGLIQPQTPNQGHRSWIRICKNIAGGIFFVAKEHPSRTHPKKAVLDISDFF